MRRVHLDGRGWLVRITKDWEFLTKGVSSAKCIIKGWDVRHNNVINNGSCQLSRQVQSLTVISIRPD